MTPATTKPSFVPPSMQGTAPQEAELIERAARAVRAANKMLPQWRNFARVVSRRPNLKVILSKDGPATDGETILLHIPTELADLGEHVRPDCGQRDKEMRLVCAACACEEEASTTVYHEIAHIVYGTFAEVSDAERKLVFERAVEVTCKGNAGSPLAQALRKHIEDMPQDIDYINMADYISPFMPMLFNAIEDTRVNAAMMRDRPGTIKMFQGSMARVFGEGIEMPDGSRAVWGTVEINSQAIIGVFCESSRFNARNYLDPRVGVMLDDPRMQDLCNQITQTTSALDVYRLAFPVLEVLRDHGFCLHPDDPSTEEPEPEEDNDDAGTPEPAPAPEGEDGEPEPDPDPEASPEQGDDVSPGDDGVPDEDAGSEGDPGSDGGSDDQSDDPDGEEVHSGADDQEGSGDDERDPSDDGGQDACDASSDGSDRDPQGEGDGDDPSESDLGGGGSSDEDDLDPSEAEQSGDGTGDGGLNDDDSEPGGRESGDQGDQSSDASGDGPVDDDVPSDASDGEAGDRAGSGDDSPDGVSDGSPGDEDGGDLPDEAGDSGDEASGSPDAQPGGDDADPQDGSDSGGHGEAGNGEGESSPDAADGEGVGASGDGGGSTEADGAASSVPTADGGPSDGEGSCVPMGPGDGSTVPDDGAVQGPVHRPEGPGQPGDDGLGGQDDAQICDLGDVSDGPVPMAPNDPAGPENPSQPGIRPDDDPAPAEPGQPVQRSSGSYSEDHDPTWSPDAGVNDTSDVPVDTGSTYTEEDLVEAGTPEDVERAFKQFGQHGDEGDGVPPEEQVLKELMEIVLEQIKWFDTLSLNITGVDVIKPGEHRGSWSRAQHHAQPISIPESILQPALGRLRMAFTVNKKAGEKRHLKGGSVDARVLGRRAPAGDERLFKKRNKPDARDYAVGLCVDTSASNNQGIRLKMVKEAVYAQAELLWRLGIPFFVICHTGVRTGGLRGPGADCLGVMVVKDWDEPWDHKAKQALADIHGYSGNLDGHALEFFRKKIQGRKATDKMLLYYTDGDMPAANFNEELEILQREIGLCKRLDIKLLGVGVQTNSPQQHGLKTFLLNNLGDVVNLVDALKQELM